MMKLTKNNWQRFCSDNFLDEEMYDLMLLLSTFRNVEVEINKHEGKNMLNVNIQLMED